MTTVSLLEAKANLSRLIKAVESGVEREIIIARNGKPAARLVALAAAPASRRRIGLLKDKFVAPADLDADAVELLKLF